jgi:CubicO group peptidase (beta-lactamase class C family)
MTADAAFAILDPMSLAPLPGQPADVAWPTAAWPTGEVSAVHPARLDALLGEAFDRPNSPSLGETHALLIVQGGRLVLERYGQAGGVDRTQASWSIAKSITQALVGILVGDGKIRVEAPADVPEWAPAADPRREITLGQLLRMSSGLAFVEDYVGADGSSDVLAMLYGAGKADMAHYAASRPLEHAPGSHFSYSSGTTNIVSRCAARALGAFGPDFEAFMRERLFAPLGMTSPVPKFDDAGTFIGSSYCFCTARDFARFGLLYLRDGVWDGQRLLPIGWADYARTPTWRQPGAQGPYGAHWWLGMGGPGSFSANGFENQHIVVMPDLDMVLVRLGRTPLANKDLTNAWIGQVIDCFRT